MGVCGFRRNHGRSTTTTWNASRASTVGRYSIPISPVVNNYFN
jgi:hypothetical protein